MPNVPPTITAAPPAPQRNVKATFSDLVDAFVTWLVAAVSQFGAVATNVYGNAVQAYDAAVAAVAAAITATDAAAAATATAGATLWVSGQSVVQHAAKISPLDHQTYRRKTATGSGTVDPALDQVNYTLLSVGQSAMELLGVATVGSAVANIDFLNVFSSKYNEYVIAVDGATNNGEVADTLLAQVAVAGALAPGVVIYLTSSTMQAAAAKGATGRATIINARSADKVKMASAFGAYPRSLDGQILPFSYTTEIPLTGALSGFRLLWQAGSSFTSGTVRVYGLRAAL